MPNIRQIKNCQMLNGYLQQHLGNIGEIETEMELDSELQILFFIVEKTPVLLFYNQTISDKAFDTYSSFDPSCLILQFSPNSPNILEVLEIAERAKERITTIRTGDNSGGELLEWPELQLFDPDYIMLRVMFDNVIHYNI